MIYNFNVKDEINPIVVKFNYAVTELIRRVEKEIGCVEYPISRPSENYKKTVHYEEVTRKISSVTYVKMPGSNCLGGFTLVPRWDGLINIQYQGTDGRVLEEIKGISITSFVANLEGETLEDLKAFWKNPTAKQIK